MEEIKFDLQLFADGDDKKDMSSLQEKIKKIVSTESEVERAKMMQEIDFESIGNVDQSEVESMQQTINDLQGTVSDLETQLEKANQEYLDAFYNGVEDKEENPKKEEKENKEEKQETIDDIVNETVNK